MSRVLKLRVWRGPQPIWRPERCAPLMRPVASSRREIKIPICQRDALLVRLSGLRTRIIKSTLSSFSRAIGTKQAPTSAHTVRAQGLQTGVQRARRSTQVGTWIAKQRTCRAPGRHCRPRQRTHRGGCAHSSNRPADKAPVMSELSESAAIVSRSSICKREGRVHKTQAAQASTEQSSAGPSAQPVMGVDGLGGVNSSKHQEHTSRSSRVNLVPTGTLGKLFPPVREAGPPS